MSLSAKDDPRTWLVPGPREVRRPPLEARLLYYDIATNERALLRAMCEQCDDGSRCWASHETYALTSDLSLKTIHDLIHGRNYIDRRPPGFIGPMNGRHVPGLIDRRILIELAPAKKPSRRRRQWRTMPAMYAINESALALKPEILARLEEGVQQTIPGISRPPRPGEPVEVAPDHPAPRAGTTRHHVPDHPAPRTVTTRHHVPEHPAPRADDSRAFDSKTVDTKALDSKAGGDSKTPPVPKLLSPSSDLAEALLREIGQPASRSLIEMTASAIEAIRTYHEFATNQESCDWLKSCIVSATSSDGKIGHGNKPLKFWLEDGDYVKLGTPPPGSPQAIAIAKEADELAHFQELMRSAQAGDSNAAKECFSIACLALPAAPAVCDGCGGRRLVHQQPHLSGPRLIPCPKCGDSPTREDS